MRLRQRGDDEVLQLTHGPSPAAFILCDCGGRQRSRAACFALCGAQRERGRPHGPGYRGAASDDVVPRPDGPSPAPVSSRAQTRSHCVGVGCTAAVVSSEPRRGHHHCFYALASRSSSRVYYARLEKGRRSRVEEDEQISLCVRPEGWGGEPAKPSHTRINSRQARYTLQALASFLGLSAPPELNPVPLPRSIAYEGVGTEQPWLVAQAEEQGDGLSALLQGTLKPMPKSADTLALDELPHPRFQVPSEPVAHAMLFGTPWAQHSTLSPPIPPSAPL